MTGFQEYTYNLVSGEFNDFTTVYAISDASKLFTSEFTGKRVFSLQAIWSDLAGVVNGTIELYMSNDGVNFNAVTDSLYTLSGASGNIIWIKNIWNAPYIGVKFIKNTITTGNLKILLSTKLG